MSDIDLRWELPNDVSPTLVPSQPPVCIHVGRRICLYAMLTGQPFKVDMSICHAYSTAFKAIYVYMPCLKDNLFKEDTLIVGLKLVFALVVHLINWFWYCANYCSADYHGQMQDFWKRVDMYKGVGIPFADFISFLSCLQSIVDT